MKTEDPAPGRSVPLSQDVIDRLHELLLLVAHLCTWTLVQQKVRGHLET